MLKQTKDLIYEKQAAEHSKNAIFLWIIVGIIWILIDNSINLFSLIGLFLILPGIFVASFASMPLFLLRNKIALNIIEKGEEKLSPLIPILTFLDLIEMIIVPIIYLKILSFFL